MKRIVVIGGGFGGIYSVKNLLKYFKNKKDIEIILLNKDNYFLFTPLLHEVSTGSISIKNIIEPIRDIFKSDNFHFLETEVKSIDFNKKSIYYDSDNINYDYVIVSIGATENYFGITNAQKYCLVLKNLKDAIEIKNRLIACLETATKTNSIKEKENLLRFVVIGGGPTGVELIAEITDFIKQSIDKNYRQLKYYKPEFYIIQKSEKLIPMFNIRTINNTIKKLKEKGVNILLSLEVNKVGKNFVQLKDKTKINSRTIIWAGGVKPNIIEVIPKNILHISKHFKVNKFLEIENTENAYALGDCALFFNKGETKAVPALAQVAIDEAAYVAKHINAKIKNEHIEGYNFKPKGYLISLGQRYAAGNINKINLRGFFAWWLWRTIYLFKLVGHTNKIKVAFDWTLQLIKRKRDTAKIKFL